MFNKDKKYGNIHINNMSIEIDKLDTLKLKEYEIQLKEKQSELIEEQNNYISKIIN